jgi:hypothetical protein
MDPLSEDLSDRKSTEKEAASSSYAIPKVYQQVYQVLRVRKDGQERVSKSMVNTILSQSRLSSITLEHIWTLANPEGYDSVDLVGLNTVLGLVALAQQGKQVDMDTLLNSTTIPCPKLYGLDEALLSATDHEQAALYSLTSPRDHDTIQIDIAPEKHGTLFKYTLYYVSSKVSKKGRGKREEIDGDRL